MSDPREERASGEPAHASRSASVAIAMLAGCLFAQGCVADVKAPDEGVPYVGTGEPIYVNDFRGGWGIREGGAGISSEQALAAAGDEEYERRRQIALAYNRTLDDEVRRNRVWGGLMMAASVAVIFAVVVLYWRRRRTARRRKVSSFQWLVTVASCAGSIALGGVGCYAANKTPAYHVWRTPEPLDRPAYVRQATELYNVSIGAPPIDEQPGAIGQIPQAVPGQRMAEDPGSVE